MARGSPAGSWSAAPAPGGGRSADRIPVARLNHAVLYVRDATKAARVLRPRLRFRGRRERLRRPGRVHAFGQVARTTTTSACFRSGRTRRDHSAAASVLYHLAWEVPTIDDLAAAAPRAVTGRRHGRRFGPWREQVALWRGPGRQRVRRRCGACRARHGANTPTKGAVMPLDLDAEVRRWCRCRRRTGLTRRCNTRHF